MAVIFPTTRADQDEAAAGSMIFGHVFDAGTQLVVQREVQPKMDEAWWKELDFETRWQGEYRAAHNIAMRDVRGTTKISPWPIPLNNYAAFDRCQQHKGIRFRLLKLNPYGKRVPEGEDKEEFSYYDEAGQGVYITDAPDCTTKDKSNPLQKQTRDELRKQQTENADKKYLRLEFKNEQPGCNLLHPLEIHWTGVSGRYAMALDDNDLFVPFDLGKRDRYNFLRFDGTPMRDQLTAPLFVHSGSARKVNLYLVPRRWKWFAKVLVHYEHGNWFQSAQNDEIFLQVFWDRPPFYPKRANLPENNWPQIWHPFENQYLAYDEGIEWKWEHSRAAQDMADQIMDQQWWSLCEFYIYTGNEPACVTTWRMPPMGGDIVCGIGIYDDSTKHEDIIWVELKPDAEQKTQMSEVYPQTLIGQFWCDYVPVSEYGGGVWVGF